MKVNKKNDENGYHMIELEDNDKSLTIFYGGNLDLYWTFRSRDVLLDNEFIITKENYGVYNLFAKLFYDMENINIYEDQHFYNNEARKEYYKLYNKSNYNILYNEEQKLITWYSDETAWVIANILKIKKEKDSFKLEFYIQPKIEGFDEDFHSKHYIPIRFRNSGSFYEPFNVIFMRMYNHMKDVDDVLDDCHQIHIEEYLHQKVKKK